MWKMITEDAFPRIAFAQSMGLVAVFIITFSLDGYAFVNVNEGAALYFSIGMLVLCGIAAFLLLREIYKNIVSDLKKEVSQKQLFVYLFVELIIGLLFSGWALWMWYMYSMTSDFLSNELFRPALVVTLIFGIPVLLFASYDAFRTMYRLAIKGEKLFGV